MKEQKSTRKKQGEWFFLPCDVYEVRIAMYIGDSNIYSRNGKKFISKHFNKNAKSILKDINDLVNDKENNCGNWCMDCRYNNRQDIIIFLEEFNVSNLEDVGVFIHECTHAVFDILNFRNVIEQRNSNNEAAAYLMEYITKNFLDLIKKKETRK